MPYPESCPECGGAFRNTGTHYTARRNEVGRHVLLELGCQNTSRRYWWDFTSGSSAEDSNTPGRRTTPIVSASDATHGLLSHEANGHATLATLEAPTILTTNGHHVVDDEPVEDGRDENEAQQDGARADRLDGRGCVSAWQRPRAWRPGGSRIPHCGWRR